jgi:protein required for attachment to host cells
MSQTDLDALDRLHAAATKGEWWAADNSCYCEIRSEQGQIGDMCSSCHIPDIDGDNRELSTANAKCAAALKNAYPALAAELREARKRVRELEAEIEVRDNSANLVFDTLKAALPNRGFHSEMKAAEAAAKEIAELRAKNAAKESWVRAWVQYANSGKSDARMKDRFAEDIERRFLGGEFDSLVWLDARDRRMKALGAAEALLDHLQETQQGVYFIPGEDGEDGQFSVGQYSDPDIRKAITASLEAE